MKKDFADTFVSFARGEITKAEMNNAVRRLSQDVVRNYTPRRPHAKNSKSLQDAKPVRTTSERR